jgi:hypothetical protein
VKIFYQTSPMLNFLWDNCHPCHNPKTCKKCVTRMGKWHMLPLLFYIQLKCGLLSKVSRWKGFSFSHVLNVCPLCSNEVPNGFPPCSIPHLKQIESLIGMVCFVKRVIAQMKKWWKHDLGTKFACNPWNGLSCPIN